MAVLDKKVQDKIDELSNQSYEYYSKGEKEKSYELMEKAWETYPEPPENWNESFNTARYALDDLISDGELKKAQTWLGRLTKVQLNLKLWEGIYQFYVGKFNFEKGNYKKALEEFTEAVKIGKGYRYFENQDPRYLDLYKNPKKYIS